MPVGHRLDFVCFPEVDRNSAALAWGAALRRGAAFPDCRVCQAIALLCNQNWIKKAFGVLILLTGIIIPGGAHKGLGARPRRSPMPGAGRLRFSEFTEGH